MTPNPRASILALVTVCERERRPFPSNRTVAAGMRVSPATVVKHLNRLMDRNIIHAPNTGTRERFYRIVQHG